MKYHFSEKNSKIYEIPLGLLEPEGIEMM